jgi:ribonuclease D
MNSALPAPRWIDTTPALRAVLPDLRRQSRLAVDTEANSLHAYRERVCLIQFSTPQADYLVDPLKLHDLTELGEIFANPRIEKVFHAVEYDLIGLQRDFGFTFANLFDTMVAARTLGYKSQGLGSLLAEKFNIILDKKFQKADWGQRPLPEPLIDYARLDTHYLLMLRDALEIELHEKGRWELATEDFTRCCHVNNNHSDLRERWERINGQQDMTPRQRTILHELWLARERIAEKLDRPLFKVIDDRLLISIAQAAPRTLEELKSAHLTERQIDRFGRAMLEAVRAGNAAPLVKLSTFERPPDAVLNRLTHLKQWRKQAAEKLEVDSDVILSRTHMQMIADKNPRSEEELSEIMKDCPWRFEHYGAEILKALGVKQQAEA